MPTPWEDLVSKVANSFPLRGTSQILGDFPKIAVPIDHGCIAKLSQLSGPNLRPELHPLDVEQLLDTVVTRLANCMTIREKAQELEVRALSDGLNYMTQSAFVDAAEAIERALAATDPSLLRNAVSLETDGSTVKTKQTLDSAFWNTQLANKEKQLNAMRDALEANKERAAQPGNGSNLVERFEFLSELFWANFQEAYARSRAVAVGLHDIYGLTKPVPPVVDVGYLNKLVLWAQDASDSLDKVLDNRFLGTVALALGSSDEAPTDVEILKRNAEYNPKVNAQTIEFNITSRPFDWLGMKSPRIRGIDLRLIKADFDQKPKYWAAHLLLPEQRLSERAGNFTPQITLAATYVDSDYHRPTKGMRSIHNADPVGTWKLRFPSRALTGQATNSTEIQNVLLFLKVSYEQR